MISIVLKREEKRGTREIEPQRCNVTPTFREVGNTTSLTTRMCDHKYDAVSEYPTEIVLTR